MDDNALARLDISEALVHSEYVVPLAVLAKSYLFFLILEMFQYGTYLPTPEPIANTLAQNAKKNLNSQAGKKGAHFRDAVYQVSYVVHVL